MFSFLTIQSIKMPESGV